ncbi:MAG: bacterial Ig-like domain-containing protein [Clostridia bacterium]|nr:bacterial Ig-like domain-containing protein [Clostridia bacterium]
MKHLQKAVAVILLPLLLLAVGCNAAPAETASPTNAPARQAEAAEQPATPTEQPSEPTPEPTSYVPNYEPDKPYPVRIAITKAPDKADYDLGETFDTAGMIVTATYSDHSQKEISDYTVETADALTLDDTSVALSYGGLVITQPITVTDPNADPATIEVFRFDVDGSQLYMVGYLDQHFEMPFGERFVQASGKWSFADGTLTLHVEEVMMAEDPLPYDLVIVPDANGDLSFTFKSVVGEKLLVCPASVWVPALDGKVFA